MPETKRPLIAGNWKMNGDPAAWKALAADIARGVARDGHDKNADVVICPPTAGLAIASKALMDENATGKVFLGGQNVYPGHNGAFTGETSPQMLKSLGCDYVILGHSERRELLSETDMFVAKKTIAALETGLVPIVCVGEGDGVGDASGFLTEQLTASLKGVGLETGRDLVIAYEPIWAIGTGKTATPDVIEKATTTLRETLKTLYGDEVGGGIRILYGGSMKGSNAAEIMAVPDVAGGLIGGASLKADAFLEIIKNAC